MISVRSAALLAALALLAPAARATASEPSGRTLDGSPFSPASARGQVLIVNFWATWCAPCRAEMPALDAYYRAHRAQGLAMVAISVDAGASAKTLRAATSRFAFPVARLDDTTLSRRQVPTLFPTTRIFDRAGVLRYETGKRTPFTLDAAALDRIVTPLLARPAP